MKKDGKVNPDTSSPAPIDFPLLLASSVHDIKNSLGMLLSSLDEMIELTHNETPQQCKRYSILRGEASRINNALIYLLGLYRLQTEQLTLSLDEVFIAEFLEEQLTSQQLLLDVNNIEVSLDCDEQLAGYFDEQLVAGIISNIVVNCVKYTHNKIMLSAQRINGYLQITIMDNGQGYPKKIIENIGRSNNSIDFSNGSTNLGLFFSEQIANMHSHKNRRGYIELSNLKSGGGCFKLFLP